MMRVKGTFKLTQAQLRLLEQAERGPQHVQIATGNNGSTRAMLRRLMELDLMQGHVITPAGLALLRKTREFAEPKSKNVIRLVSLDRRIKAQETKLALIDERIGRLMSQRVDLENALAELYAQRNPLSDHGVQR